MTNLYLIVESFNVYSWEDNEIDEINPSDVHHIEFDTEKERLIYIDALYLVGKDNYIIIDETEYKILKP